MPRGQSAVAAIDDQIAAAFNDGANSKDVADLVRRTQAALRACNEEGEDARARALDPKLPASAVAKARREMDDLAFRRERLSVALSELQERVAELAAEEEDQRRWVLYEQVKAERDALAAEFAATYPAMAEQLTDLMGRIAGNDRSVAYINSNALPRRGGALMVAELVARELPGFVQNNVEIPSVTRQLRLPAFRCSMHHRYDWPPNP